MMIVQLAVLVLRNVPLPSRLSQITHIVAPSRTATSRGAGRGNSFELYWETPRSDKINPWNNHRVKPTTPRTSRSLMSLRPTMPGPCGALAPRQDSSP